MEASQPESEYVVKENKPGAKRYLRLFKRGIARSPVAQNEGDQRNRVLLDSEGNQVEGFH